MGASKEYSKNWRLKNKEHLKQYQHEWRKKNYKHIYEYSKKRRRKIYEENLETINKIKSTTPCKDCGVLDLSYLMNFDHVGKKRGRVHTFAGCTKTMLDEISQCEVVCVRCHAIRTHNRGQLIHAKKT